MQDLGCGLPGTSLVGSSVSRNYLLLLALTSYKLRINLEK
jgi:hypothetical protein